MKHLSKIVLWQIPQRYFRAFCGVGGGLCVYLAFLYGVGYVALRPDGLPSAAVQLFTFVFYALAIIGLWLHRKREPLAGAMAPVEKRELRLVAILFAVLLALALALSLLARIPVLYPVIAVNFVIWTLMGFVLAALSLAKGVREYVEQSPAS